MAQSPNPIFKDETREGESQKPAQKKTKTSEYNFQVHFYVGEELKSSTLPSEIDVVHDSEIVKNDDLPTLATFFKRDLVYNGYKLRGKLAHADHSEVISLPKLYPRTVIRFLNMLNAKQGENATFNNLDNLVSAFVFATAIKDIYFQQQVIQQILTLVQNLHTSSDTTDEDLVFEKVLERVGWAWSGSSEARIGLRRALTMCFAWLNTDTRKSSEYTKKKSGGNEMEMRPVLDLCALEKLGQPNLKWEQGLLLMFAQSCKRLMEHNKQSQMGWVMVPANEVYPESAAVDLTLD